MISFSVFFNTYNGNWRLLEFYSLDGNILRPAFWEKNLNCYIWLYI